LTQNNNKKREKERNIKKIKIYKNIIERKKKPNVLNEIKKNPGGLMPWTKRVSACQWYFRHVTPIYNISIMLLYYYYYLYYKGKKIMIIMMVIIQCSNFVRNLLILCVCSCAYIGLDVDTTIIIQGLRA